MGSECCLLYLFSQWKHQNQSADMLMKVGVPVNNSRLGDASCIQLASTPKLEDTKLQIHSRMECIHNLESRRQGRIKRLAVWESVNIQLTHNCLVFTASHILHLPLGSSCSTLPSCIMQKIPLKPKWLVLGAEITPLMPKFSMVVSAEQGQGEGKGECDLSPVLISIQFLKWKATSYGKNLKECRRCNSTGERIPWKSASFFPSALK